MAIASLITGIVALVTSFMPVLNLYITIPLGLTSALLGWTARRQAVGLEAPTTIPTAGFITGSVASLLGLVGWAMCAACI